MVLSCTTFPHHPTSGSNIKMWFNSRLTAAHGTQLHHISPSPDLRQQHQDVVQFAPYSCIWYSVAPHFPITRPPAATSRCGSIRALQLHMVLSCTTFPHHPTSGSNIKMWF